MDRFSVRPLVGVSACLKENGRRGWSHTVGDKYVQAVIRAVGALPVLIPAFGPEFGEDNAMTEALDRLLDTRKWIAVTGTSVIALILGTLALWGQPPLGLAVAAIVGIGFLSASSTMVMTHGRGIFPDRLIGRGMATMNTSVMLGVGCMQTLSGVILGAFAPMADGARSETAYRTLFGFMCVVLLVAMTIFSRAADIKPSDELRERQAGRR